MSPFLLATPGPAARFRPFQLSLVPRVRRRVLPSSFFSFCLSSPFFFFFCPLSGPGRLSSLSLSLSLSLSRQRLVFEAARKVSSREYPQPPAPRWGGRRNWRASRKLEPASGTRPALFNETRTTDRSLVSVSSHKLHDEVSQRAKRSAPRGRNFRVIDIIPGEDYKYSGSIFDLSKLSHETEFIKTRWLTRPSAQILRPPVISFLRIRILLSGGSLTFRGTS